MNEKDRLDVKTLQKLLYSFMVVPFPMMQLAFDDLKELSQSEIENAWRKSLKKEVLVDIPSEDPPFELPFELEEDWAIVTHLRLNGGQLDVNRLFDDFGGFINLSRSASSIEARANHFLRSSPEEVDYVVSEMAKKMTMERIYEMSLTATKEELAPYRLTKNDLKVCRNPDIFDQMEKFVETLELGTEEVSIASISGLFFYEHPNTLAVFRSEEAAYYMRRRGVIIGKDNSCDINLSRSCTIEDPALSSQQITVEFTEDFEFLLRNVGRNAVFVNGVELIEGQKCRLPSTAILELPGDIVLLFAQNRTMIDRIRDPDDQGDYLPHE